MRTAVLFLTMLSLCLLFGCASSTSASRAPIATRLILEGATPPGWTKVSSDNDREIIIAKDGSHGAAIGCATTSTRLTGREMLEERLPLFLDSWNLVGPVITADDGQAAIAGFINKLDRDLGLLMLMRRVPAKDGPSLAVICTLATSVSKDDPAFSKVLARYTYSIFYREK